MSSKRQAPADLRFGEAIEQLEGILSRVEAEEIDIDELADQLKVAAELLEMCRSKIRRAEVEVTQIVQALEEAEAMLNEGGLDPDMKEFVAEEKAAAREKLEELEQDLRVAVLEKDPRDEKNAIVEGDELAYGAHMNPSGLHEAINKTAAAIESGDYGKLLVSKAFIWFLWNIRIN